MQKTKDSEKVVASTYITATTKRALARIAKSRQHSLAFVIRHACDLYARRFDPKRAA